jgi:acetylornithine deacetylase/succinyl-diaminopimelate desuccinylase-like protein
MKRDAGSWDAVCATVSPSDQLEYLRQVLSIPSPGGEEGALARFVAQSLRGFGVRTELAACLPGRPAVVARLPGRGRGPSLMLLAHLDVPAMAPGWTRDPFRAVVTGGRIYGAGVRDMKAGLAAMVMAMRALRDARVRLEGDVVFVAVPGHMEQGVGAKRVFDAGVTADLVLVGEPTGLDLLSTHLGWSVLEVTVHGRETSTVTAAEGINALERAAIVVRSLARMRFQRAPVLAYVRRFLPATPCYVSTVGIQGGNPYYPNVVPGRCTLTVDVRFVPGKPPREILREVKTRLAALARRDRTLRTSTRLKYDFALEPVITRPEEPLYRVTRDAVRWARGTEPRLAGFFYTTDGGVFQEGSASPTVVCGPGHAPLRAPDEWVTTREYLAATAVYVRAALETAGRTREAMAAAYPSHTTGRPVAPRSDTRRRARGQ